MSENILKTSQNSEIIVNNKRYIIKNTRGVQFINIDSENSGLQIASVQNIINGDEVSDTEISCGKVKYINTDKEKQDITMDMNNISLHVNNILRKRGIYND